MLLCGKRKGLIMSQYYIIHDFDQRLKEKYGSKNVPESELKMWNERGFGIHYTPNTFEGNRCAANLKHINYWIADIDDGTKEEQMSKIHRLPIFPSKIVETKRGYHCYWLAKDATPENYRKIEEGIIKLLGADPQCKDVCHTLRAPGYFHLKDPKNPFYVHTVFDNCYLGWTEKQMLMAFVRPDRNKPRYIGPPPSVDVAELIDPANWEKFYHVSRIGPGNRNAELARITMWLRDAGCDLYNATRTIEQINASLKESLPQREINTMLNYHFKRKGV